MTQDTFEVYEDKAGKWRWRARAANGAITATSGESFDSRGNAARAALRFQVDNKPEGEDGASRTEGEP